MVSSNQQNSDIRVKGINVTMSETVVYSHHSSAPLLLCSTMFGARLSHPLQDDVGELFARHTTMTLILLYLIYSQVSTLVRCWSVSEHNKRGTRQLGPVKGTGCFQ